MVVSVGANAADWYVSPAGDDDAPGSIEQPFATIQHAADVIKPGDTCWLREGTYRERVSLATSGAEGAPICFMAFPGEVVTLCGTDPLDLDWQVHEGSIYRAQVDREFEQLFVDGDMMIEARWPNMRFDEMWDRSKWAFAGKESRYGKMHDPALAETGIDFTGALATLNIVHQFYTWTRFVTEHEAGRDWFAYPKDFGKATEMRYAEKISPWIDDRYYLSGVLGALDVPTEWFLDRESMTLYLWTADGGSPAGRDIQVKARDYAIEAEEVSHIELRGLHFFGATFRFYQCTNCTVDSCHLLFPTYTRELTDLNAERRASPRTLMFGDFNTIRNCSLGWSATVGFVVRGRQTRVENCLVHDVCWNGSLRYAGIDIASPAQGDAEPGARVRTCTVFNCGNVGVQYRQQPTEVAYNHVYDGGLACKDVALIYTGSPGCAGSVVHHNWVHGCRTEEGMGLGIRGDDQTRSLTVHHNVVWDCGRDGIIVKGDLNRADNNTVLFIGRATDLGNFIALPTRAEPVKPWRKQHPLLEQQNQNSFCYNNVARTIVANQGAKTPFPESDNVGNNFTGEDPGLVDMHGWDFRPREGSPLIDAGREVEGVRGGHLGAAPDIGAHEYGGEQWRPGHHNGVWLSAPRELADGRIELQVALLMPPLEPTTIDVSGQALAFTSDDWARPRTVTVNGPLTFEAKDWGSVDLAKAGPVGAQGLKLWFPRPDVGTPKRLDVRYLADYFPTRHSGPHATAPPSVFAFMADGPVTVDGDIGADEWVGLAARPLLLRAEGDAACEALVQRDGETLLVAFRGEGSFGEEDQVRVLTRAVVSKKVERPLMTVGGLDSARQGKARFAAQSADRRWQAEFSIPLSMIDAHRYDLQELRFDLGVTVGGVDFGWAGPAREVSDANEAGRLFVVPPCSVSAATVLTNGDFEAEDLAPWYKTNNQAQDFAQQIAERVREVVDGGWCMKLACDDAELMKDAVLKWLHPLDRELGSGTYVLSYDVRVAGLQPRGGMGMTCSYIRTETEAGGGRNGGQRDYGFTGADLPWTHRDMVIELEPEEFPSSLLVLPLGSDDLISIINSDPVLDMYLASELGL